MEESEETENNMDRWNLSIQKKAFILLAKIKKKSVENRLQ